jgi:hypothetical protein
LRNAIHAIFSALLWVVFVYYWQIVMQRPMNPDTRTAMVSLGVLSFFTALYLTGWVYYNIRISRKFQRRKVRVHEARRPLKDYMGRWIVVDHPENLRTASYVEIDIKRSFIQNKRIEEKIFRTVPEARDRDV